VGPLRHGEASGPKPRRLNRRDAYRQVAELLGGKLHEGKRASGDRVLTLRDPWRIWLDTYTVHTGHANVTYTRVRASFRGWRELRLTVRRKSWVDRLFRKMGFGKPLRVDRRLLECCVVRGRPRRRVPLLLDSAALLDKLLVLPSGTLRVKRAPRKSRKRFGEDTGEVVFQITGVVTDVERLAAMVRTVGEMLGALERVGEARREGLPES